MDGWNGTAGGKALNVCRDIEHVRPRFIWRQLKATAPEHSTVPLREAEGAEGIPVGTAWSGSRFRWQALQRPVRLETRRAHPKSGQDFLP